MIRSNYSKLSARIAFGATMIALAGALPLFAQEPQLPGAGWWQHEVEARTDNDMFAWNNTDRYYTYGLSAYYRKHVTHNRWRNTFWGKWFSRAEGLSLETGIALEAYTPGLYDVDGNTVVYDRPFAGHAYVSVMPTFRYSRSLLQLRAQAGVLGPASQAGEIQNWFHRNFTDNPELQQWDRQIDNEPAINLVGTWVYSLLDLGWLELVASPEVSLGSTFTYALPRIQGRIGRYRPLDQSVWFRQSAGAPRETIEYFLSASAGVTVSAYDATLSDDDFSDIFTVERAIGTYSLTAHLTYHRIAAMYRYVYTRNQLAGQSSHRYGAVSVLYRF